MLPEKVLQQKGEFVRLWLDPHAGKGYILERIGCKRSDMEEARVAFGLPHKPNPTSRDAWEPSEEDIERGTQEIQANWSKRVRSLRATTYRSADKLPEPCPREDVGSHSSGRFGSDRRKSYAESLSEDYASFRET